MMTIKIPIENLLIYAVIVTNNIKQNRVYGFIDKNA